MNENELINVDKLYDCFKKGNITTIRSNMLKIFLERIEKDNLSAKMHITSINNKSVYMFHKTEMP